ncbi:peptidoglycan bridge formation glycyltransferase FemA/FemB family protein [Candidatus Saccharibacteria bacterium]|nr:peptidoglycan bridge formation glycyltransferase FemA/FemB family protein [Candidatus Saccharibacteria bacterium]
MTKLQVSFLQSPVWAKFQRSIHREVIEKSGDDWSYLAIVERGQFSNRLYCPYGPTAISVDKLSDALNDLRKEAKARKLDFVRVEPITPKATEDDLRKLNLRPSDRFVEPPSTLINDVSVEPDQIRAQLSQSARRYARKCDAAGVTYSVSYDPHDIKFFLDMIHEVRARTGLRAHDDLYFREIAATLFPSKDAGLLLAELDNQKIAAIIFYTDGETMSYAHAASLTEFRKISPATGLGLYALLFAHEQGCKNFDWFGVAPEGSTDPRYRAWQGFTQFKQSFGGQRINRLGTWELPLKKVRYLLYRLMLKLTGQQMRYALKMFKSKKS